MIDDLGDAVEFEKDIEAKGDFLAGEASGFDDAATACEVGPGKVSADEDAELKMVPRKKFLG